MSIESPSARPSESTFLKDLAKRRLLQVGFALSLLMAGGKAAEAGDAQGEKLNNIERIEKKIGSTGVKYAFADAGIKEVGKGKEVHYFATRVDVRDDKGTKGAGDDWQESCTVVRADAPGESVFALDCQESGFRANPLLSEGVGSEGVGTGLDDLSDFEARAAIDHVAATWSAYEAIVMVGKGDAPEAAHLLADARDAAKDFMKTHPNVPLNAPALKKMGIEDAKK